MRFGLIALRLFSYVILLITSWSPFVMSHCLEIQKIKRAIMYYESQYLRSGNVNNAEKIYSIEM